MSFWSSLGDIAEGAANIGTLGIYGAAKNILGGNANPYRANEAQWSPYWQQGGANSLWLQDQLKNQAQGIGPNLGDAQFQKDTEQIQRQNAGAIAGIKGMNPAAQARLLMQQNAQAQGLANQNAAQTRIEQQLAAQQQLGQQSLGMFDAASARALGAANVNAGVTNANAAQQGGLLGGLLGGGGSALGMLGGGKWEGGRIGYSAGGTAGMPESRLGQMVSGMYDSGRAVSFESGGSVGGHAPVAGDSPRNDNVPAMLSPGEIVIPRSHSGSPEAAADFVRAIQARGYAEGGEVDQSGPSFTEAVRRWWSDRSEHNSRDVADAIHSALPDWMSARTSVKRHNAELENAYEQTKEQ